MSAPISIGIRRGANRLELTYEQGNIVALPDELLRVVAPMPPGQASLVAGKKSVSLLAAEPVGNYALRLKFSDGFDTSVFSWEFLHDLGREQNIRWRRYLRLLEEAGLNRD